MGSPGHAYEKLQPSESQKVQKTAIVKMDLQCSHVEAGLIHRRCKQKFGAAFKEDSASPTPASKPASPVTSPSRDNWYIGNAEENEGDDDGKEDDGEDVVDFERDFERLAEKLISTAEADDKDEDEGETTIPAPQNSSSTNSILGPNASRKTLIPRIFSFIPEI